MSVPTLHLLGTGAAVSDPHRTTTMLAFSAGASTILVDCGGDVIQRVMHAGLSVDSIEALIITHEHPDHCAGFPLFMEKIWLAGRRRPIAVYGPEAGLSQARRIFAAFDTSRWDGLPEIEWHPVPLEPQTSVLDSETWRITASPGDHGVPVIGVSVEHKRTGSRVAYSCDTRPSPEITALATEADVLVHEATGAGPNHSSIEEAADVAANARAGRLLLVHLPPGLTDADLLTARRTFPETALGQELGSYAFAPLRVTG